MTQGPTPPAEMTPSLETPPPPSPAVSPVAAADPPKIAGGIEAILFSTDRPVQAIRLASALGLVSDVDQAPAENAATSDGAGVPAQQTVEAPESTVGGEGGAEGDAGESTPVVVVSKPRKTHKKATPANDAATARAKAIDSIRAGVAHLNHVYHETGRSFRIESLAGGFRVMTLPEFSGAIAAFQGARARTSLSPAALETLAIVSYKQPITRARLEAIRGVACGEILRSLMERRLVTIVGRAEELGRPMLYGTTARFLELFGLSSLKDLPTAEELRSKT